MNPPDKELRRLVDGWYDGALSKEDAARLEQRLSGNAEAKAYFLEVARIEAALPEASAAGPVIAVRRSPWQRWLRMAAMFMLGAGLGGWAWQQVRSRPAARPDGIVQARITGMLGVTWPPSGAGHPLEFQQGADAAAIESGLLELTFSSGTRAVIEGPARFRIRGENGMRLDHGKLVAEVPKGAEGFRVSYAGGEIIDLGTEFALDVPQDAGKAHLGVFRGEIEYHPAGGERVVKLTGNHAVEAAGGAVVSVPFDQARFTREIPSREFSWELTSPAGEAATWEYDVSHLIWKAGSYRAICKWMKGRHGVMLEGAALFRDGVKVAEDPHHGFSALSSNTTGNIHQLEVSPADYKRGRWTLRMYVRSESHLTAPLDSRGVLLVEDGLAVAAQASDFIGTWEYLHDGEVFRRTFRADGSAEITIDGKRYLSFPPGKWEVVDGCLLLKAIEGKGGTILERHLLRDRDTLIFVNCPYRDAVRVPE